MSESVSDSYGVGEWQEQLLKQVTSESVSDSYGVGEWQEQLLK
jgi:2-hydroxy-3-keto-5-methylthiopentenyl-1-phosphate phosphatase